jgi:FkbM family methyltransferase
MRLELSFSCFEGAKGNLMKMALLAKLAQVFQSSQLTRALVHHRVLAGGEHRRVLMRDLSTVIDIGANRGQFALAVRRWAPRARIISFEPLPGPSSIFRKVFVGDDQVSLIEAAIGPSVGHTRMHVSERDDSSSLLPISSLQTRTFPGTREIRTEEVRMGPLNEFVSVDELKAPAMLKLDVQGFEYEALTGCESILRHFLWVYCECSFVELYTGQRLACDIIAWLAERGFLLADIQNPACDESGHCIQADFLFSYCSRHE